MDPVPSLDKVYNLVLREEAQRNMLFQTQPILESSAMLTVAQTKKKFKNVICSHCGKKEHNKEKSFRIIRFPEDSSSQKGKTVLEKGR